MTIALKDLDLLRTKEKFKIDGDMKMKLLEIIKKDTAFFARCEIIDYSLLIGIHQRNLHQNTQYLISE